MTTPTTPRNTNYASLPEGCEWCSECDGVGFIETGEWPATFDEPPAPRGYRCESCGGEGVFAAEPEDDEDFDAESDDAMDGDAESALASAGFGTDEDYGGFCDLD
jgi:hypothetical protein